MKRLILALALAMAASSVYAACTYHYINGKTCTTCCYGSSCTTTCS